MTDAAAGATLDAAVAYVRRGWSVIPIRAGEKRPLVAWQPYQDMAASEAQVRDWFRRWPDANVGVVTGAVSGLVVLDIDPGHGGADSLARLERRHGDLPRTIEALTGGGGRHVYFAHAGRHLGNRAGLLPGIDLRGDGGMVVAPPSLHPSGRRYAWRPGHAPDDVVLADMPAWLLRPIGTARPPRGHGIDHWRALVREGVGEGVRNSTIASLTGHLLWHEVDLDVITELLLCWNRLRCRPPLSDDEVVQTIASIARTHERGEAEADG